MSLSLRKILATTAMAITCAAVVAPAAGANTATANHPKLVSLTDMKGNKVGDAIVSFDHHTVTVWAYVTKGTPGATETAKVWLLHNGYRRIESTTVCSLTVGADGTGGCIATVDAAPPHHNDVPVLGLVHGTPMHLDAIAML